MNKELLIIEWEELNTPILDLTKKIEQVQEQIRASETLIEYITARNNRGRYYEFEFRDRYLTMIAMNNVDSIEK